MATEPENQSIRPRHRRVLKVLAKAPRGRDVNALLSRGVRFQTLVDLVRRGLARVELQSMGKRGSKVQVAWIRITDVGLKMLEGQGVSRAS